MSVPFPQIVDTSSLQKLREGAAPEEISDRWPVVDVDLAGGLTGDFLPVTFAAYAPSDHEVLLHINGLVDSHRTDFAWVLLPHVSVQPDGRAVHARAYLLPKGMLSTYRLVIQPHIARDAGATRQGWKAVHELGRPDPLNPSRPQVTPLGGDASTLVLPGGPALHPAWSAAPAPSLAETELAPGVRWLETGRRDRLAVIFDAEQWRGMGLESALARMGSSCPGVLLVDLNVPHGAGVTPRARGSFLPDAEAVASVVLPALEALRALPGWEGLSRERILATGQSFGGLAAVGAVALTGWAGQALAQSASLHYTQPEPGAPRLRSADSRPHSADARLHRAEGLGSLMRRIQAADPSARPGRIDLVSGTLEPGMVQVARQAVPVLNDKGHQASVRSRVGGHDYAWWRHELLFALEEFGRPGPAPTQLRE